MPVSYDYFPVEVSEKYRTSGTRMPMPSRPFESGVKATAIVFTSDSGMEQRRNKTQPRATFSLQWIALSADQFNTLRDFYIAKLTTVPFLWTHPLEKQDYLVRFDMDSFSGINKIHNQKGAHYETQVKLVQVFA